MHPTVYVCACKGIALCIVVYFIHIFSSYVCSMQVLRVSCAGHVPYSRAVRGDLVAVCLGGGLLPQGEVSLRQAPHPDPHTV